MNQTTESSAGVPFVTNSLNIQTTGDDTIEIIDHELIIEILPINDPITNTTFITTDAFNRLHNSPISAIPGSLPTIDFIASNIAAPDSLVSIDATNTLNKSKAFTNFAGDIITPGVGQFDKLGINISPAAGSPLGILKLSNLSSPASNWGTRAHWYISDEGGGGTRPFLTINASRNYDQSITWGVYWNGTAWTSSDSLDSFKWQRNFDKMFFSVSFGPQTANQPVIEKSPLYIKSNNNIGFYVDGSEDGGLYLLSPDVSTSNIIMLSHNSISKKTETIDRVNIWGQNLGVTDDVEFIELSVGPQTVTPATDTRSQLKISGPIGDLGPFPKNNIGGRLEIYNDGNQYPLVSLSCFRPNDCALSFGSYGSSIDPWVKSDVNFFKWQKLTAELGLYCNQTLSVAGNPAFEELMVKYNNTGLNPVIEYHQPVKLFSTTSAPTNTRFLTLNDATDEIEERVLPAFGTGDVSWVGVGASIDNSVPRFDGVTGLIIQGSNIIIDDSDNITGVTSLNTGQGANLLYSMDQDVLSNSTVSFKNIFCDNILQSDFILETTLNQGVKVDSWQIKTQNITSDALSDVNDPLSINLKYFGDANIPLSISAPTHDDLSINFDCHNVVGFPDSYISGSVLGNIILDKSDDLLRVLVTNGNAPGAGFLKSAMNSVLEVGKTFINLNQVATFAAGVVMNALTTDPETQADSIFITQSSLTNEIFKRPYESIYATAINTASVTTPLVLNVWTVPALVYALTLAKNCTPILDTITIDAGIDSHLSSISYDISCASFDNLAVSYQSAIRINGFIVTSSICNFIIDSNSAVVNVANTSIFTLNALDDVSLVVRNIINNKPLSITKMCITINKVFQ